ncbi:MAG: MgtC/SapB family protein [Chloroflexi bacterium]|nr:MgtC/SapB family protein [Chloroflexota bacterium]
MEFEIMLRVFVAAVLGGGIGLQRGLARKSAGIRTHALICLGAALFTSVAEGFETVQGFDPSRIAAGVVTGIGFVGAGVILRSETGRVEGVTTAASIWATAAVGVAIGTGLYIVGTFTAILAGTVMAVRLLLNKKPK